MTHPLVISGLISAGTYITTKTISYLSDIPAQNSCFHSLRNCLAESNANLQNSHGRSWSIFKNVYWDNLWISTLAISVLFTCFAPLPPLTFAAIGNSVGFMLGAGSLGWITRFGLSKMFAKCSECVAPRMEDN